MGQHTESQQGSASNSRDMEGSVALMFLTIGDVNNPDIWEGWLREANPASYDIYVHAKRKEDVQHRFFRNRHVETVPTKWGTVSLVKAHVNLLRAAIKNKRNKWFVLLSDSCLPMVSFETLQKRLREELVRDGQPISAFDTHPGAAQKDQRRNLAQLAHDARRAWEEEEGCSSEGRAAMSLIGSLVAGEEVVSHSQWCLLGRADARALARAPDPNLHTWFDAYRRLLPLTEVREGKTLAADELLLLSFLRRHWKEKRAPYKDNHHWARLKVTLSHCCLDPASCRCSIARAAHPLAYETLHPDIVSQSLVCASFFARKFKPGMHLKHWEALWNAQEPETKVRVAQVSTQLSRPHLLTERQALHLGIQLSLLDASPAPASSAHSHSSAASCGGGGGGGGAAASCVSVGAQHDAWSRRGGWI